MCSSRAGLITGKMYTLYTQCWCAQWPFLKLWWCLKLPPFFSCKPCIWFHCLYQSDCTWTQTVSEGLDCLCSGALGFKSNYGSTCFGVQCLTDIFLSMVLLNDSYFSLYGSFVPSFTWYYTSLFIQEISYALKYNTFSQFLIGYYLSIIYNFSSELFMPVFVCIFVCVFVLSPLLWGSVQMTAATWADSNIPLNTCVSPYRCIPSLHRGNAKWTSHCGSKDSGAMNAALLIA